MHMNDTVLAVKERTLVYEETAPPKGGLACVVKKGQHVRVIDVEGKQAGDLAFFNEHNIKEKICNNLSRSRQFKPGGRYTIKDRFDVGDVLYSTGYRPMLTIVAETAVPGGRHEIELHSCNVEMYERLGLEPPPNGGCWEILSAVLAPYGITPEEIPDTFDCFGNLVHVPEAGEWRWETPVTRPGDFLEFRAEMDVIMGLSVCPMDFDTPLNNWVVTPLKVEVYDVQYWERPPLRLTQP